MDLRYTYDHNIVIFHDETICGRRIRELKLKEAKRLDEDLITLPELITWLRSRGLRPLLKLDKKERVNDYEILEEVKDYPGKILVNLEVNFKPHPLPYLKLDNFELEYGHSSLNPYENLSRAISFGAKVVSLTWPFLDEVVVRKAHERGLRVDVYYPRELNIDEESLFRIVKLGVDYLTIKDPILVSEILRKMR